ncbi:MAG: DUF2459 domain-containing protein, partial [Alphaproteobacteria bacterium]|nr:DUF2459 domain-containing protein [Alphaproteobacteria bacterium]
RRELVATGLVPEAEDFPDAAFLEFGWGDRVYYPAREKTLGMALDAALTGSPAILHMAGLAQPPDPTARDSEVVTVALTEGNFRRLVGAIAGEFERPEGGRAFATSRGLYPNSSFYDARGSFHLFNTCNTWTARMLRAAGLRLSPSGVVTADKLMARLRAALASDRPSGGQPPALAPPIVARCGRALDGGGGSVPIMPSPRRGGITRFTAFGLPRPVPNAGNTGKWREEATGGACA